MSVESTIAGEIILASSDVGWVLREGVRPNIQTFDVTPKAAENLAATTGPVTLKINDILVMGLYVLNIEAGEHPYIRRVRVADRRIWWSYKFINRLYNKRRNIGFRRVGDPGTAPEIQPVVPRVWYRRWTLKNTGDGADPTAARWKAVQVLRDVLGVLSDFEQEHMKSGFLVDVSTEIGRQINALDIEDLQIKENGDQAVLRVLAYLPEAGITVTTFGNVLVYSKASGDERRMIQALGPPIVGEGDVALVSNKLIRPRRIEVYYQYLAELRFDADERAGVTRTVDDRFMDNVLPTPDFTLTLADGNVVVQGTWITFDEAFAAWGVPFGFSTALTHDMVQKTMVPFMDLWAGIQLSGAFQADADWAARIGAVQQHYRRTYRINRQWIDRITALRPHRSATINPSTGTRSPAIAYSDYAYITGQRALFNEKKGGVASKDFSYAVNVKGHPALQNQAASLAIDTNSKSAPAHVRILDADQGIIQLDYEIDPYRLFEAILPSMITLAGEEGNVDAVGRPNIAGPTGDVTNRGRPLTFDAIGQGQINKLPKLTANHKASMILSAIPGAPNSEASLYKVVVQPQDVRAVLPRAAQQGLRQALGPPMQIYIGSSVEAARIPWIDGRATDIQNIFLNTDGADQSDRVRDIVLNDAETTSRGASLRQIARAAAARMYASLTDRWQGQMAGIMTAGIVPSGWLSEVELSLNPKGVMLTKLRLPERIQPLDLFSFLDSSTRAVILKLATPEDAQ